MRNPLVERPIRIFVVGPMGDEFDDNGMRFAQHITNIQTAANLVLESLAKAQGPGFPKWEVNVPSRDTGDITSQVFSQIMHCDIAIADVSTSSVNVFYELSMLHSRGVPTILITKAATTPHTSSVAFYLRQQNFLTVADYGVDTLVTAMTGSDGAMGQLESLVLFPSPEKNLNPISRHFDGVDLVNVSAVTGIAAGQVYNFLRWVLQRGFFKRYPQYKRLVAIQPLNLGSMTREINLLNERFGVPQYKERFVGLDDSGRIIKERLPDLDENGVQRIELETKFIPWDGHPREGFVIKFRGPDVIDFPTPLSSLKVSRQYRDMKEFVKRRRRGRVKGDLDREFSAYENGLIEVFFGTVLEMLDRAEDGFDTERYVIMTAEDYIDSLAAD